MTNTDEFLEVLYENKHWLAVNKISRLSVERSPYGEPTIESMVFDYLSRFYRNPYVGIVHRLDRVTTGVMLFAKRKSALRKINAQFRNKTIQKTYLALVENQPKKEEAALHHFLYKNRQLKKGMVTRQSSPKTSECRLTYRMIGQNKFGYLLEVKPITGRFHQIRVQLSHIGCPIVGDKKYGATTVDSRNAIALHALQISLTDTITEERISINAPLPGNEWWEGFEDIPGKTKELKG